MKAELQRKESQHVGPIKSNQKKVKLSFMDNRPQAVNQTKLVKSIQKEDNLNTTKGLIQGNTIQRTMISFSDIGHYVCNCQEHNLSGDKGVYMRIQFYRDPTEGHKIGFVQIVKSKTKKGRKWKSEKQHGLRKALTSSKGYRIDSMSNNPVYGTGILYREQDISLSTPYSQDIDIKEDYAEMVDKPQRKTNEDSCVKFITRAIDLDTKEYLGAITWGFSIESGNCVIEDAKQYMMPSTHSNRRDFNSAIKAWNKLKFLNKNETFILSNGDLRRFTKGPIVSGDFIYSGGKKYHIAEGEIKGEHLASIVNLPTE